MNLPLDLPIQDRARYLIFLDRTDYESIPREELIQFLSPLFPETRPKNEPNKPNRTSTTSAKSVDISALRSQTQSLLDLLRKNTAVPNGSTAATLASPPPRKGISFVKK